MVRLSFCAASISEWDSSSEPTGVEIPEGAESKALIGCTLLFLSFSGGVVSLKEMALSPLVGSGLRSPWNSGKATSESALSLLTLTALPEVVRPGSGLFFCRPRALSSFSFSLSVSLSASAASPSLSAGSLSGATGGLGSFIILFPSGGSKGSLPCRLWPDGAGLAGRLDGLLGSLGPKSPGREFGAGDRGLLGSFGPRSPGSLTFDVPNTDAMAPCGLRLSGMGFPSLSCLGREE